VACYVDDIVIYTVDWSSHLRRILQALQESDISCNPTKTEIGFAEVEYKIQVPKNVKALQRQLGMFNYFKKHVPDYSKNTYHMRQLLNKYVEFNWTPSCQKELDYLKGCLTSDPILKPIDFNRRPIALLSSCDAIIYVIGFVIMQADDSGTLHAVRYGS